MKVIPFAKPLIGDEEKKAVLDTLESTQLVHGPLALKFEEEFIRFIGGGFATSTSSATTALQLAYMALNIGVGDEVIVTSLTHVATANSIRAVGAVPVFVDIDTRDANISVEQIEEAISEKTKAICVVHFIGRPAEMSSIMEIALRHKLFVIEDCALALGSRYNDTHVGLVGDFGAFSFYPAKHITTGEGGMLISKNSNLVSSASKMKAFFYDKGVGERKVPGVYDVIGFGLNYRMSEIAAAIGIEQIKKLPTFLERRKSNTELLFSLSLDNKIGRFLPHTENNLHSSHYCASFVLNPKYSHARSTIISRLNEKGIGTSVYYPIALPESQFYRSAKGGSRSVSFERASKVAKSNIAFGIGPHIGEEDVHYIAHQLHQILKEIN